MLSTILLVIASAFGAHYLRLCWLRYRAWAERRALLRAWTVQEKYTGDLQRIQLDPKASRIEAGLGRCTAFKKIEFNPKHGIVFTRDEHGNVQKVQHFPGSKDILPENEKDREQWIARQAVAAAKLAIQDIV